MHIIGRKTEEKLKSKSGASLVLALLVFLFCAMIDSTVLAAAMSSSGTLTSTWENDRDVYLLKSAAGLMNPSFEKKIWKASEHTIKDGQITVPASSTMDTLYDALCIATYNNSKVPAVQSITFTLGDTSISTAPVTAAITMDDSYNVTVIYTKNGTARKVTQYFSAATADSNTTQGKGSSVTWNDPVITIQ
ncbi:MAG: hypothetical protein LKF53_00545 [Solobacterium sp.]|jgi:hypothetical protein|nr:hypothetical protein [Solobacterium sp.]MCH4204864.1 hypothetical protein [Solobacterium sp.]MCH4226488.1 hypothetical protein [Solobacterium sp.]MCH4283052.1 hypothetical protein [Solobacterium sp.]